MADTMHIQKFVLVNTMVDAGVLDLIKALGEWWPIMTYESCQGNPEKAWPESHVSVHLHVGNWGRAGNLFQDFFNPFLAEHSRMGDRIELRATGSLDPDIHLLLDQKTAEELVEYLIVMKDEWNRSTKETPCDTESE